MYKAVIAIVSLLGGGGAFLGIALLGSAPSGPPARLVDLHVSDMHPPPLEPASAPELGAFDSPMVNAIYLKELHVSPRPHRAVAPVAEPAPPQQLRPCSDWEEVGPKSLQNQDDTVQMQHARLLC